MSSPDAAPIHRLLDAIELIHADRKAEAVPILRELIRENANFEEAWLWMSVAVESLDQSVLCLENVLRINPRHTMAKEAMARLHEIELASKQQRARLRSGRDTALMTFWIVVFGIIIAIFYTYSTMLYP